MELILGLFGIVAMIFGCPMTFALIFSCKTFPQVLVAVCTFVALCAATYYAFKCDLNGGAPFVAGLLWLIGGFVLSTWLDFQKAQSEK